MKTLIALLLGCGCCLRAGTTIDAGNRYAFAANLGWMDWAADTANGAVIGEYVCSGFIYSANAGWINFETNGAPKVDLRTGNMSGYVWSANCGWISLSNALARVQTDTIRQGALAPDGLPIAWLLLNFGATTINAGADPTGKGMTIAQDYLAGTNPDDVNSILRITAASFSSGGTNALLTWNTVPTRYYSILKTPALSSANWTDSGLGLIAPSAGSSTTAVFTDTNWPMRFYRVEAVRPLLP